MERSKLLQFFQACAFAHKKLLFRYLCRYTLKTISYLKNVRQHICIYGILLFQNVCVLEMGDEYFFPEKCILCYIRNEQYT